MSADRATVIARHVYRATGRRRRDGMNYEILTAGPGEEPKVIARMSHGGDAYAYAAEITRRVQAGGTPVDFTSTGI